jgi:hypothetical protein
MTVSRWSEKTVLGEGDAAVGGYLLDVVLLVVHDHTLLEQLGTLTSIHSNCSRGLVDLILEWIILCIHLVIQVLEVFTVDPS